MSDISESISDDCGTAGFIWPVMTAVSPAAWILSPWSNSMSARVARVFSAPALAASDWPFDDVGQFVGGAFEFLSVAALGCEGEGDDILDLFAGGVEGVDALEDFFHFHVGARCQPPTALCCDRGFRSPL